MRVGKGMDIQECYRILEVDQGAEWMEIRKSFYRLAKECHPDRNVGNTSSEEKFKKISLAYETLEQRVQSHQFSYRVYSHAASSRDHLATIDEEVKPFDYLPEGPGKYLNRWTHQLWRWLQGCEKKWLELNVEKVVSIDPVTASNGGIIKVKNTAGSFHVEVPRKTLSETFLRVPGKGERGLLNRKPGDLLLKIEILRDCHKSSGISEYFYNVRVIRGQFPKVRILNTHEGPIKYRLPGKVKDGQSFILKSKPQSQGEKVNHHILVIELV